MIDEYEINHIRTTEMKWNEEWSSQLWTQFMQLRSQLRWSFFIRIKHITYNMYICLTMKSFRTSILALFIGLWDWLNSYQLILHLMVDMDPRTVEGLGGEGLGGLLAYITFCQAVWLYYHLLLYLEGSLSFCNIFQLWLACNLASMILLLLLLFSPHHALI